MSSDDLRARLTHLLPHDPGAADRAETVLDEALAAPVVVSVPGPLPGADGRPSALAALVAARFDWAVVTLLDATDGSLRPLELRDVQKGVSAETLAATVAAQWPALKEQLAWMEVRDRARWVDRAIVVPPPPPGPEESNLPFRFDRMVGPSTERNLLTGRENPAFLLPHAPLTTPAPPDRCVRAVAPGVFDLYEEEGSVLCWIPGGSSWVYFSTNSTEALVPQGKVEAGTPLLRVGRAGELEAGLNRVANGIVDEELEARAQSRAKQLAEPFLLGLNAEALAASQTDRGIRVDLYNYLAAGGDAEMSKRRVQAARAVGALKELLPELKCATLAIDSARPLLPALMEDLPGLDKTSLRLLARTDSAVFRASDCSPADAVKALAAVRPDHHPDRGTGPSDARWSAFLRTWKEINGLASECKLDPKPLMALEAPLWLKGEVRAPVDRTSTRDAVIGFHRHILVPLALDALAKIGAHPGERGFPFLVSGALGERGWRGTEILQLALLRGRSTTRMEDLAKRWHAEGAAIGTVVADREGKSESDTTLSWAPLAPPWTAPSGATISALTTDRALVEESDAMNHCVGRGAYLPKCLYESTHILSIKNAAGERLSTVEIQFVSGHPQVIQHHGHGNKSPSAEAKAALEGWVQAVGKEVQIDGASLDAAQDARLALRGEHAIVELVGYDISKSYLREAMFKAYAFMLPRGERELGLADWIRAKGLDQAITNNVREDAIARAKESEERRIALGHFLPRANAGANLGVEL